MWLSSDYEYVTEMLEYHLTQPLSKKYQFSKDVLENKYGIGYKIDENGKFILTLN